jgi:hypothetical protein
MSIDFDFYHQNSFLNKKLIKSLDKVFKRIFESDTGRINHNNVREFTNNMISEEIILNEILKKIHKKFQILTNKSDLKFDKLWLIRTLPEDVDFLRLPYIPHFDKKRYLKAMIYLHDVNLEHGPIHIGKLKNKKDIEKKRKKLPADYKLKGLNTFKMDQIIELKPIIGKAGDVIFFDTNNPHKAGIVKKRYYREVLRFDFERPNFNLKKFSFSNFISKTFFKN